MNLQFVRSARLIINPVLAIIAAALLLFGLPGSQPLKADTEDCDCHPWEYCDENGDCHDKPHTHHLHHVHHEPEPGETCWVECLCEQGTSPASDTCAPCEFVGTVCIGN